MHISNPSFGTIEKSMLSVEEKKYISLIFFEKLV